MSRTPCRLAELRRFFFFFFRKGDVLATACRFFFPVSQVSKSYSDFKLMFLVGCRFSGPIGRHDAECSGDFIDNVQT